MKIILGIATVLLFFVVLPTVCVTSIPSVDVVFPTTYNGMAVTAILNKQTGVVTVMPQNRYANRYKFYKTGSGIWATLQLCDYPLELRLDRCEDGLPVPATPEQQAFWEQAQQHKK